MFRRDYIVRMIEDMTAMVAKVLTLKQDKKTTEALWEVDELLMRHFSPEFASAQFVVRRGYY
ncbi:DUF6483 family protein [Paenibacillus rhizoplanae]